MNIVQQEYCTTRILFWKNTVLYWMNIHVKILYCKVLYCKVLYCKVLYWMNIVLEILDECQNTGIPPI